MIADPNTMAPAASSVRTDFLSNGKSESTKARLTPPIGPRSMAIIMSPIKPGIVTI